MKSGGKFKLVDGASVPANWEFGKLGDIATNIRKGLMLLIYQVTLITLV